jgi:hypothetical protein
MDFGPPWGKVCNPLVALRLAACIIGLIAERLSAFFPESVPWAVSALTILLLWPLQATDAFKEPTSVAAFAGAVFIVSLVTEHSMVGLAAITVRASETSRLVMKRPAEPVAHDFRRCRRSDGCWHAGVAGMVAVGWRSGYLGPAEHASIVIFILLAGSRLALAP